MDATSQGGTIQAGAAYVIVWGWDDMKTFKHLETTLVFDEHTSILTNHLHPLCSLSIPMDLDNSRRTMQYPKHWELLPSGSRSTHLTSHFYSLFKSLERNIIEQIWDAIQYAIWYRFLPLRIPVNFWTSQQDSWWELSPGYLQTILNNNDTLFCGISAWSRDALHDIRLMYQFSWHVYMHYVSGWNYWFFQWATFAMSLCFN